MYVATGGGVTERSGSMTISLVIGSSGLERSPVLFDFHSGGLD